MTDERLRWQCRRGMRELDELLTGYLERQFDAATAGEQHAFRQLLALADDELFDYLLGGKHSPDRARAHVISQIVLRTPLI